MALLPPRSLRLFFSPFLRVFLRALCVSAMKCIPHASSAPQPVSARNTPKPGPLPDRAHFTAPAPYDSAPSSFSPSFLLTFSPRLPPRPLRLRDEVHPSRLERASPRHYSTLSRSRPSPRPSPPNRDSAVWLCSLRVLSVFSSHL